MQQDNARSDYFEEAADMEELLDEVMMIMEDSILRNNVNIRKNIIPEKEMLTVMPRSKLFNIMLNLIKNAAESVMSNKPDDRSIEISMDYDDRNVLISVSDNGRGISVDDMKHLFEYGFTTKEGGNGFGLHFCANTLKEMNGTIIVKSEGLGMGAEFLITIPRAGS